MRLSNVLSCCVSPPPTAEMDDLPSTWREPVWHIADSRASDFPDLQQAMRTVRGTSAGATLLGEIAAHENNPPLVIHFDCPPDCAVDDVAADAGTGGYALYYDTHRYAQRECEAGLAPANAQAIALFRSLHALLCNMRPDNGFDGVQALACFRHELGCTPVAASGE